LINCRKGSEIVAERGRKYRQWNDNIGRGDAIAEASESHAEDKKIGDGAIDSQRNYSNWQIRGRGESRECVYNVRFTRGTN